MAKGDTWNNWLFGFGKAPGYLPHYSPYFEFVKSNFHKQNQIFKSYICHRLSSKWAWILIYFNAMPANFQTNVTHSCYFHIGSYAVFGLDKCWEDIYLDINVSLPPFVSHLNVQSSLYRQCMWPKNWRESCSYQVASLDSRATLSTFMNCSDME